MVTSEVASVSPYPVHIESGASSSRMRSSRPAGTTVEAAIVARSDDRSVEVRRGESRMAWKTVGGPNRMLTCSRCIVSSTASTSNVGAGMIVAPCTRHAIHPAL